MTRTRALLLSLALVALTAGAYAPVLRGDFVNFDDDLYVTGVAQVRRGLGADGVAWAFTTFRGANWFPLTWLSWMADATLSGAGREAARDAGADPAGGLDPRIFHATSLALHCFNTALLFAVLLAATGAPGRSAFVAGVFALHPLHVESVAWISARKDVLSGFFFLLALLAHTAYARRPSWPRLAGISACMAAGLLAKPVLVTLPFVLLLFDVWPLRRIRFRFGPEPGPGAIGLGRAVAEKLPLVALAAASSIVTYFAQESWGAVQTLERVPASVRLANALVSYVAYVVQALWPTGLAAFYPHPQHNLPLWQPLLAAVALVAASVAALRGLRRRPALAVGWLWYVGMLVPVIGLVQVGSQARADRYTYLPLIGLAVVLAWGVGDLLARRPRLRGLAVALGTLALVALAPLTWAQAGRWRDSFTLFEHALRVTDGNYVAHINLGVAHHNEGRADVAADHLEEALRLAPSSARAAGILAEVRRAQGRAEEALPLYKRALAKERDSVRWLGGRADALLELGRLEAAVDQYRFALLLEPENAQLLGNLGLALYRLERHTEAVEAYERALVARPGLATVRGNLGVALVEVGQPERALAAFQRALAEQPEQPLVRAHLGRLLLGRGDLRGAIEQVREAVRGEPDSAPFRALLGQVLQRAGRDGEAARAYREALAGGERSPETLNNFAWLLATSRDAGVRAPGEAVALATEAADATGHRLPEVLDTLSVAYAAAGRQAEAERTAARAADLAEARGAPALAEEIRRRVGGEGGA